MSDTYLDNRRYRPIPFQSGIFPYRVICYYVFDFTTHTVVKGGVTRRATAERIATRLNSQEEES